MSGVGHNNGTGRVKRSKFTDRTDGPDIGINAAPESSPCTSPLAVSIRRPRRPYDKRNIKVFPTVDGKRIAVEAGMVGSIADAGPGQTAVLLKFAGQNPVVIRCDFLVALHWWIGFPDEDSK